MDDISEIIKELCFIGEVAEYRDKQTTKSDIAKVRNQLIDIMKDSQTHKTEQATIITVMRTT